MSEDENIDNLNYLEMVALLRYKASEEAKEVNETAERLGIPFESDQPFHVDQDVVDKFKLTHLGEGYYLDVRRFQPVAMVRKKEGQLERKGKDYQLVISKFQVFGREEGQWKRGRSQETMWNIDDASVPLLIKAFKHIGEFERSYSEHVKKVSEDLREVLLEFSPNNPA